MAYTYEVPLSYTVNVSLSATPAGLADFNTNSIAIFSNEPAGFSENYQAYISLNAVESDFGTNSLTYKMAQALFTPAPNFRTGNGVLYVFPFKGQNATSGSFTTIDISKNIVAFKSVQDGVLNIAIDGQNYRVSDLDFTSVNSVADIVNVLKSQNLDVFIEADEGIIRFTSKRFGTVSSVVLSKQVEGSGTDITASGYLDISEGSSIVGINAGGQALSDAVSSALEQVYFGGVLTTQYQDADTLLANAQAIQAQDVTYFNELTSLKDIVITGANIKSAGLGKTRSLAYSRDVEQAKIAIATYATIAKSVNYNGDNTAITMNLKTLTGVLPDNGLSDTYVMNANANGVDIYGNTGGISVVYSNDNNGYTDDIEANLWHKKATEVAGFNYLRQTGTKIPQTEEGMTGLKSAYAQVCEKAIRNNTIGAGTWNTAIPFGNPDDFRRNIEEKGYYIYSIPIAQQSQSEREARKAPVCQIALKRSGAFHHSDVIINIER